MTISTFIHENITLVAGTVALLIALLIMEMRAFATRGANLSPSGLSIAANRGATIVDIRSHEDYRSGHIAGAKSMPNDELDNHIASLGEKDSAIVLYCKTGSTSAKAVAKLRKLGFSNVQHLKGGIAEWNVENLPVTKKG